MLPARRVLPPVLVVLLATLLAACGGSDTPDTAAAPSTPAGPQRVVVLDPGLNGANASHTAQISKKVPDGRGGTKPCDSVGTATDKGTPEHEFNWNVADDVRSTLQGNGVKVIMSRAADPSYPHNEDENGVGPCVDQRGKLAGTSNADLEVSIYAREAPAADHGFAVYYAKPALNSSQGGPALSLAETMRDALTDQQLTVATDVGANGLKSRKDLATLNLATRPAIMVDCGNMKNADDAINMNSDGAGQARFAQGIATGILNWLSAHPPGSAALANASDLQSTDSDSASSSASSSEDPSDTAAPTTTTRRHTSTTTTKTHKPTTSHTTRPETTHSARTPTTESDLPG